MAPLSRSQIYTYHLSGLQFTNLPYDNRTGLRPVHNLQTGWHPIQSIRLIIYEPDVRLSSSQILKNENRMASSGVLPEISKLLNKRKVFG